ncbi:hypothetical protein Tco_0776923 [Tanacetum coccineum]
MNKKQRLRLQKKEEIGIDNWDEKAKDQELEKKRTSLKKLEQRRTKSIPRKKQQGRDKRWRKMLEKEELYQDFGYNTKRRGPMRRF